MNKKPIQLDGFLPGIVFVLHGLHSNASRMMQIARRFNNAGFKVVIPEYRGHGNRKKDGNDHDLAKTLDEIKEMIEKENNPVFIYGTSAGGAMAISLAILLPSKVIRCFGISAPHDISLEEMQAAFPKLSLDELKQNFNQIRSIMPGFYKGKSSKPERLFLVHSRNDSVCKIEHFEKNKAMLGLSDSNAIVLEQTSGSGKIDHVLPAYDSEIIELAIEEFRANVTHGAKQVIITVPHAAETNAFELALQVEKELSDHVYVRLYVNQTVPREIMDMNRSKSRETSFRKAIKKEIDACSPNDIFIDLHSAKVEPRNRDFDIYLLDMGFSPLDNLFNENLIRYLKHYKFIAFIYNGDRTNDIIKSTIEKGMKNVSLIEINQRMPNKRIHELSIALAGYFML